MACRGLKEGTQRLHVAVWHVLLYHTFGVYESILYHIELHGAFESFPRFK